MRAAGEHEGPVIAAGSDAPRRAVRRALWERDGYVLLFGLLLVDYVMLMVVNSSRWSGLLRVLPIAVTVLFALHTSEAWPRLVRLARLAAVVSLVLGVAQAASGNASSVGNATFVLEVVLLLTTPVAIFRRVLTHSRIDLQTVFAALDVYILLGLIFAVLFQVIGTISWQVAHVRFLAQPRPPPPSGDYVYLSFVTLTTVGFGDITPYTSLARSVVVLEALIGQIFLVTLVARMVSMFGSERPVRPGRHGLEPSGGRRGPEQSPPSR